MLFETTAWVKLHKREITEAIIGNSTPQKQPIAIIMAGIPGAGKTEFLSHVTPELEDMVVIDLDNIVGRIKGYKPKNYYKYRKPANILVSAVLAKVLKNKISFALDGTFSHAKGTENIARALNHGFEVNLFFVYQDPGTAWEITKARKLVTGRPIEREGFMEACRNVIPNIQNVIQEFRYHNKFFVSVVKKDNFEQETYQYLDEPKIVDSYLKKAYNFYKESIHDE